jgi:phosphohistidine phosphatase SixA
MQFTSRFVSPIVGMIAVGLMSFPASVDAEPLKGRELIEALKKGGYTIYLRHATTDHNSSDQDPVNYTDPSTQRNLSEDGKARAAALGRAVRALGIPVGRVVTTPFCRGIETGWLAFGKGELSDDLAFAIGTDEAEAKRLGKSLKQMMSVAPAAGTNNIYISHSANLKEAVGVWPKEEGVSVVFKPSANGELEYLGEIPIQQWPTLSAELAPKGTAMSGQDIKTVERSALCGAVASRPTTITQQAKR